VESLATFTVPLLRLNVQPSQDEKGRGIYKASEEFTGRIVW